MKQTISFKFNILTSILMIVLLAGFGAYNYQVTSRALHQQLDKKSDAVLTRLEKSVPNTIWNFEMEQLGSIIESETASADVLGIFVYDDKKMLSGRMTEEDGSVTEAKLPDSLDIVKERALYFEDGGVQNKVGRVLLLVDDSQIKKLLSESLVRLFIQTLSMVVILVATNAFLLNKVVTSPIKAAIRALQDIAEGEGDLTRRLRVKSKDEIAELATVFNRFVGKIQDLVRQIMQSADMLSTSTEEMNVISVKTSEGVSNQRSETDQVAAAMNEMSATAHDVARNAVEAAAAAQKADQDGQLAREILSGAINSIRNLAGDIDSSAQVINELEQDVVNITSVLDVIRGIAEQTNLLALNAAIEAARAGEQGRGFAVVADEVRTLASKTQASTQEIQEMISRLQTGTGRAVSVMKSSKNSGEQTVGQANKAEVALNEISSAISTINDMNTQIASAAEQQTAVTEDINRSLTRIVEIAEDTARGTDETREASARLAGLSEAMHNQMASFKV
ncbi:MAG: methyl-accepting chemotaxis protein [Hahellaceae bacterium]|nr:methyl-accepting chemotaxis protein [Hahellaceae bacterium]